MKTKYKELTQNKTNENLLNLKQFSVFIIFVLFAVKVFAKEPRTEAGLCMPGMSCYSEKLSNLDASLKQFLFFNSDEVKKEAKRVHLVSLARNWVVGDGQKCEAFTNELGVSSLGKEVMLTLTQPTVQALLKPAGDVQVYCPNFSQLSDVQVKMMYVVLLQGMSLHESSCTNGLKNHDAPNGVANGILQLHRGKENTYLDSKQCPVGASSDTKKSVRCGLGMIARQVENDNKLFSQASYWHVLRPLNGAGTKKPTVNSKAKDIRGAVQQYCHSIAKETGAPKQEHLALK